MSSPAWWIILVVVSLAGFFVVASVARDGRLDGWEVGVLQWLDAHRAPWWDFLALTGAAMGSRFAAGLILVAAAVWFVRSREYLSAAVVAATLLVVPLLISGLKSLYGRPRPTFGGEEVRGLGLTFSFPSSAAFPSGHALIAAGAFGTLAVLLLYHLDSRRARRTVIVASILLILVICWSRVYLAVHYPTDVIAGLLVGLAWLAVCAWVVESRREGDGGGGRQQRLIGSRLVDDGT